MRRWRLVVALALLCAVLGALWLARPDGPGPAPRPQATAPLTPRRAGPRRPPRPAAVTVAAPPPVPAPLTEDDTLDPELVASYVQALADDVVLTDCSIAQCGGARFEDPAAAEAFLSDLSQHYPGAWVRTWPDGAGGTLTSFVVGAADGVPPEVLTANDLQVAEAFAP